MNKSNKSSAEDMGEVVNEIIGFENGEQKTINNIITGTISVGMFTKFKTTDGKMVAINHKKVNWFEII